MKKSRKQSLEKKLAAAISVVNLLNATAPIALPYVNVARNVRTAGGYAEPTADGLARTFYGTAEAAEVQSVHSGQSAAFPHEPMTAGDKQFIHSGGTGTVTTMEGGLQEVSGYADVYGELLYGSGKVTSMTGGQQNVTFGSGAVGTMNGGGQNVNGGVVTIETMSVGAQNVKTFAEIGVDRFYTPRICTVSARGSVGIMNNGTQSISGGVVTIGTMNGGTQILRDFRYSGGGGTVYSQGSGTIGTMNGGEQNVESGGVGTVTTMNNGGTQTINSGGNGTVTNRNNGGVQTINSGGVGTVTIMNSGGVQTINSGATGTIGTMNSGGVQKVSNGCVGTVTNLNNGGVQNVNDGGSGTVANLNNGGVQNVNDGGNGTVTNLNDGGVQNVSGGGHGTVTNLNNGGVQNVSGGGHGTVTTIYGGTQTVLNGGVGTVGSILSGGVQNVSNGGTSLNTTVGNGGTLLAAGGAIFAGTQTVESGGVASGGTLYAAGATQIINGGTAVGTVVAPMAQQIVSAGGTAVSATLFGGTQIVSSGGVVDGLTFNNGGTQIVAGGTATVTTLNNYGVQVVNSDATGAIGTIEEGGTQIVNGGTGKVTTMSGGFQTIYEGVGMVGSIDGGTQKVSGGKGMVTTMNGGTQMIRFGSGTVTNLNNGGVQTISSGGTGSIGSMRGGTLNVNASGTFAGDLTGYGTVATDLDLSRNLSQSVTASGGVLTMNGKLTANKVSVADGGAISMAGNGDLNAITLALGRQSVYTGTNDPLISAKKSVFVNTLDITGLRTKTGKYTIISAATGGGVDGISDMYVKRNENNLALMAGQTRSGTTADTVTPKPNLTISYDTDYTVSLAADSHTLDLSMTNTYTGATFSGAIPWTPGGTYYAAVDEEKFANPFAVNLAGLDFSFAANLPDAGESMTLLSDVKNARFTAAAPTSYTFDHMGSSTTLNATASGAAVMANDRTSFSYDISGVTLNKATVNALGATDVIPGGWTAKPGGVLVDASGYVIDPEDLGNESKFTLAQSTASVFDGATFTEGSKVCRNDVAYDFSSTKNGVTLGGYLEAGSGFEISDDKKSLQFINRGVHLNDVSLGAVYWRKDASLRPKAGGPKIDYSDVRAVNTAEFSVIAPWEATANDSMTLLTANSTLTATLDEVKRQPYSAPTDVSGVTVDALLTGRLATTGDHKITYTAMENKATKLTFGNVAWNDAGALLDHGATLSNVSFNGADVDTTEIAFINSPSLAANDKMTLVKDFGTTAGTISGTKYRIGTTIESDGHASVEGNDLTFTVDAAPRAAEQTHNTVMGVEACMAALSAGNDFVGAATQGLSLASNIGADGVSTYAQMGGGSTRQETGSHIDVHTWNAIIALGRQNKQERGTFQYGAFFEYGTGNYSTFNGDLRGDGSMRYTGGGLLAKWTAAHGLYVEGSLRAGSVHDDARNVLRDERTQFPYSYTTNAPYFGFHLGVGKEIALADGNTVDVYGKYFFNRRNSVSFDAGGPGDHYDLDAVTSSVFRVGARYTMKREKWNFYGGLAYEHELDGEATGTASNGGVGAAIRGADVGGGSLRMELGATMKPDENSPWSLDLNLAGFAGKKQGFSGGVSVAFMF